MQDSERVSQWRKTMAKAFDHLPRVVDLDFCPLGVAGTSSNRAHIQEKREIHCPDGGAGKRWETSTGTHVLLVCPFRLHQKPQEKLLTRFLTQLERQLMVHQHLRVSISW